MAVEVVRGRDRFETRDGGIAMRHAFSFGAHYDAANTHHGPLVALNDVACAPDAGFAEHVHSDVEIVTWVLDGSLCHRDSLGTAAVLRPGAVAWTSAGSGVRHSEVAGPEGVRFVQAWVLPEAYGATPTFRLSAPDGVLARRLVPGEVVRVPEAAYAYVYVARGTALLGERLAEGDAVRLTGEGARLEAGPGGGEVLVWWTA